MTLCLLRFATQSERVLSAFHCAAGDMGCAVGESLRCVHLRVRAKHHALPAARRGTLSVVCCRE
jgi:hypothetical protein